MGQYFVGINQDKRQWIHPHRFGDGLKFLEFSGSASAFLAGLALLLRQSDSVGGGDWTSLSSASDRFPIVGSWAGDNVSIVGDYDESQLYMKAMDNYRDVSFEVLKAMAKDHYTRESLRAGLKWRMEPGCKEMCSDPEEEALYRDVFKGPTFQEEANSGN